MNMLIFCNFVMCRSN